jgi:hypothetical protein
MIRRRRPAREIAFSFDSFLDVVANVVGIIIRLILVVWVGARSYPTIALLQTQQELAEMVASDVDPNDPLHKEIAACRAELAEAQQRLRHQLEQVDEVRQVRAKVEQKLVFLGAERTELENEKLRLSQEASLQDRTGKAADLSLAEARARTKKLQDEIVALEKLPPVKKTLRYRTPVSKPVEGDEILFECRQQRVTFIDIAALLAEMRRSMDDHTQELRQRWQVSDRVGPVGAYRLLYVLERERGSMDALGGLPDANASFRYGLSGWELEPISPFRGETLEAALAPNSEFRQIADRIDPHYATVTFWIDGASFGMYRQLRDYLYAREIDVAGRPLPDGAPIASSRRGTISRGQ